MKNFKLPQSIRLTFAHNANPGEPLTLDEDATDKLGHVPKLLRALAECYGSRLGEPTLWGGEIVMEICSDEDLFDVTESIANELALTAQELEENAMLTPPLALTHAVKNTHCIDLLRALATTYDKSELTASLHFASKTIELPHPKLSAFTEPKKPDDEQRHLRVNSIGVCIPQQDANVLLLGDLTFLELPTADYPQGIDDLVEMVVKGSTTFTGPARLAGKNAYRALPGGKLHTQLAL